MAQEVLEAMEKSGISFNENSIVCETWEKDNPDDENEIAKKTYSLSYESLDVVSTYALQNARKRISSMEKEIAELKSIIRRAGLC